MKIHLLPAFTACFLLPFFLGCGDDDSGSGIFSLDDGLRSWIAPYESAGQNFHYADSADSVATVTVLERIETFSGSVPNVVDCEVDGESGLCLHEMAVLEFSVPDDTTLYLTVFLRAENDFLLMPSSQAALTTPIFTFDNATGNLTEDQPSLFKVTYDPSLAVGGGTARAFLVENTDTTGLAALPPAAFTFAEGLGVVAWTDRQGRVWQLD